MYNFLLSALPRYNIYQVSNNTAVYIVLLSGLLVYNLYTNTKESLYRTCIITQVVQKVLFGSASIGHLLAPTTTSSSSSGLPATAVVSCRPFALIMGEP